MVLTIAQTSGYIIQSEYIVVSRHNYDVINFTTGTTCRPLHICYLMSYFRNQIIIKLQRLTTLYFCIKTYFRPQKGCRPRIMATTAPNSPKGKNIGVGPPQRTVFAGPPFRNEDGAGPFWVTTIIALFMKNSVNNPPWPTSHLKHVLLLK